MLLWVVVLENLPASLHIDTGYFLQHIVDSPCFQIDFYKGA